MSFTVKLAVGARSLTFSLFAVFVGAAFLGALAVNWLLFFFVAIAHSPGRADYHCVLAICTV
jgi:hypothetical protein